MDVLVVDKRSGSVFCMIESSINRSEFTQEVEMFSKMKNEILIELLVLARTSKIGVYLFVSQLQQ